MSGKKKTGQFRVLAVVWSLAALSMLVAVFRQMPNVNAFSLIILTLSAIAAIIWWSAYLKASKNGDSK